MWAEVIGMWALLCQGSRGPGPGKLCHIPYSLLQAHSLLPHPQFVDTPGNLPPSMNLSQLLGLKKNLSILLAYE